MELTNYHFSGKGMPIFPIDAIMDTSPTGFPSPALEYEEDVISLDRTFIKNRDFTHFALVTTDAMKDAGILINSILIVDRSVPVKNMSTVLACVEGGFIVRYYHMQEQKYFLLAANPSYPDIEVTHMPDFSIFGVVTYSINSPNPTSYVRIG